MKKIERKTYCKCGCGRKVKQVGNKYRLGHNSKDKSTAKTHLWQKGKSGNPKGRTNGSRNKVTLSAINLIEGESDVLTRKAVDSALNGNTQMLKFCLERLVPVCKDLPVKLNIPAPKTVEEVTKMTEAILGKLNSGELTPSQAEVIGKNVDRHLKSLQLNELESRLETLEDLINKQ